MTDIQSIAPGTFGLGIVIALFGFGGTVTFRVGKLVIVGGFGAVMALVSLAVLLGFSFI